MAKVKTSPRKAKAQARPRELTVKQKKFAAEFAKSSDASAAYRRVYNAEKMKATTVNRKAHELLKNGKIAAMVEDLQAEQQRIAKEAFQMDAERVLGMFVAAATFDPADFRGADGDLKPLDELTPEQRMILEPKVLRSGAVVFVPPSREAARNELGRIFDLSNKININVTDTASASEIAAAADPAEALKAFQAARERMH